MTTPTTLSTPRIAALRGQLSGELLLPGSPSYTRASLPWNRAARLEPALVVRARTADDVQAAVRFAGDTGSGAAVMATGHGITAPVDGVLIDTSAMRTARVNPRTGRARVDAGTRWSDLMPLAGSFGLTGLPGSSPGVGVVGFSLGGGFGWLGRRFGLSAYDIVAAELVTAEGDLVRVDDKHHPDLLWALRGGTGNFGIVTSLELRLHHLSQVYGGNLFHPLDRLPHVLGAFAEWTHEAPTQLTASVAMVSVPPLPSVPTALRGRRLVAVRGVWAGDPAEGVAYVDRVRRALGPAIADTFAPLRTARLGEISADPVDPLAVSQHSELLRGIPSGLVKELAKLEGEESGSPLVMLEVRTLGGALVAPPGWLSPMAHTRAAYSLNAIGLTADPARANAVATHLERVREGVRPWSTGEAFVNFLDAESATPQRVRSAYSAADWERLIALKRRHDPDQVFRFNRNIPPTPSRNPH